MKTWDDEMCILYKVESVWGGMGLAAREGRKVLQLCNKQLSMMKIKTRAEMKKMK